MPVQQVSVILDNRPGQLARLVALLNREDITTKAIAAASVAEDSTVRLIVNDPLKAATILESFNFKYQLDPVLVVEVPSHPGGMNAIVKPLSEADINIHYIYTTIERLGEETILVIGVDDIDMATQVLRRHWINFVGEKVYSL